ncbi:STAS domain-containing protein [Rheinheimera texasensis]|uniref:STAS domain-containing protein n=1 Tax=Rheinheimera texasensis TaxID=306205 RepID=UPI0004E23123|nr:STAS domain-containing protein [Rheinheimera texasensis]
MAVVITPKADFLVVEFEQDLSIFAVNELFESLKSVPQADADKVILDLTAVSEFDSAGLQLLLWLQHSAPAKSFTLSHGDNPTVLRVLNLYNLNPLAA